MVLLWRSVGLAWENAVEVAPAGREVDIFKRGLADIIGLAGFDAEEAGELFNSAGFAFGY